MFEAIIKDIEDTLNVKLDLNKITYYEEGATDSVVFSIEDKYLIKTIDESEYKIQHEFLNLYFDIDNFQNILCSSKELKYVCYNFF